jgi:hypothetical protein
VENWFKALIVIGLVFIIGVSSYLFLIAPSSQPAEHVTSDVWVPSKWELESPPSNATFARAHYSKRNVS